jgi:hypothetical protein
MQFEPIFLQVLWQFLSARRSRMFGFSRGLSSPPSAAKTVLTISRIDHILEKDKDLEVASLRSAAVSY